MGEAAFTVDSRNKIISILNGLHIERTALTLTLAGVGKHWRSSVLKVLPEADHFFISTVGQPDIDEKLHDGEPFALKGSLRGVRVILDPLAIPLDSEFHAPDLLAVPIPNKLLYLQKRDSIRLPTYAWGISVRMAGSGWELSGRLEDISFDGCGIVFDAMADLPGSNEALTLEMTLPDENEPVKLTALVCHANAKDDESVLGFRFIAPNLRAQNTVDRFVLRLQRESCKSRRSANG